MNDEYYKWALERIKSISNDELRMIAKSCGYVWPDKVSVSRNKREGRYAGIGKWWRSSYKPKHVRSNRCPSGKGPSAFSAFCVLKTRADQHW